MTLTDGSGEGAGMRAESRAFTGAPGRDVGVLPRTVDQRVLAAVADAAAPIDKEGVARVLAIRGHSITVRELDLVFKRLEINGRIQLVPGSGTARFEVRPDA
jgi:hypothetical protein